jgi:hypothetical protein
MKATNYMISLIIAIIGLLTCSVLLSSFRCTESDSATHVIKPILIGQGDLYGNGSENIPKQNIVITDQSIWTDLINAMNTTNKVSDSFTEINIDFSNYQIIAVFDNIKQNGGHSIDITKIIENDNNIIVTVENLQTGNLSSVITQPYHIVKITKTTKDVLFQVH